jgi:uncharacterized damage-inducible protein DinB
MPVPLIVGYRGTMREILAAALFCAVPLFAQKVDSVEGLWQGFDGEWRHISRQVIALAETIPAEKYSWRPGPGVRSTSEVLMHIVTANFSLLQVTGPKMPADLMHADIETATTSKADVVNWLRRSFDAVTHARAALKPGELSRKVRVAGRGATVDGIYLRILVHANEHMGQMVAYARINGVAPPW